MTYKYITDDNLENKQTYMYSAYGGKEFLEAYKNTRKLYISNHESLNHDDGYKTGETLEDILAALCTIRWHGCDLLNESEIKGLIDSFVKTFEVRKRLYDQYTSEWKPVAQSFRSYDNYLMLAEILIDTWYLTRCTKYVSCLMKLDDSLLSLDKFLSDRQKERLSLILKEELSIYEAINKGEWENVS